MEMFNETMILILVVLQQVILGFIDSYESKQTVGNIFIFFIMFTVGINVLMSAFILVFELQRKLRRDYQFKRAL